MSKTKKDTSHPNSNENIESFFENQLERVNSWLTFAEAKNGALIAVNSGIIAVFHEIGEQLAILRAILLVMFVISSIICAISFIPNLSTQIGRSKKAKAVHFKPNLLYFGDIDKIGKADQYLQCVRNSYFPGERVESKLIEDYADEIVINSRLTVQKYQLFKCAVVVDILAFAIVIALIVIA